MYATVLKFPDGTVISSGSNASVAVQNCSHTNSVNTGNELTIGSVNASAVHLDLITPKGTFSALPASTFQLYKVDEKGTETLVGLFNSEQPTRLSANKYSLEAYDNIIKLDKDLTSWLASLTAWPYSVFNFAHMVAEQCGLSLVNTSLLNGDYKIQKFNGEGITGRKLMEWIGQICANFCRATPDGRIEFAWYTRKLELTVAPTAFVKAGVPYEIVHIGTTLSLKAPLKVVDVGAGTVAVDGLVVIQDTGTGKVQLAVDDQARIGLSYYMSSLSYADYEVAPIERVRIQLTESDVGVVYPDVAGNTYDITGNYLLSSVDITALSEVAHRVFNVLSAVRYTPCSVAVASTIDVQAGDILSITDGNGVNLLTYVMSCVQKGQRATLESSGSPRRDSSTAANNESFGALTAKMLEVRKSIEGLNIRATQLDDKTSSLSRQIAEVDIKADGITASVSALNQQVDNNSTQVQDQLTAVNANASGLSVSIQETNRRVDNTNSEVAQTKSDIGLIKADVTKIQADAGSLSVKVQNIENNGVSKVVNELGLTIDGTAVTIHRPGNEITNNLDETGMYVIRSKGTSVETTMLQANANGVIATDVSVHNYLIVGEHARFEDYSNGTDTKRTACFWI